MLISAKRLCKFSVHGIEEDVGDVKDLLFDGERWSVEYLDIDTGRWLPGRRVILPPEVVKSVDYEGRVVIVPFQREEMQNGPPLESDMPVSRQMEVEFARYYTWGVYGANITPGNVESIAEQETTLRSVKAVSGYRIEATDGELGHIQDFIVDDHGTEDKPWTIRYAVVGTGKWLPGRQVLLASEWIDEIDWATSHVHIDVTRATIKGSPQFDPEAPVNRQYEEVLYDYYGRPKYWKDVSDRVHQD